MSFIQQSAPALGGGRPNGVPTGAACCGPSSAGPGLGRFVPAWLGGRRGIVLAAITVVGAGMAFGWPTLVAFGVAPLLLSLLPFAAMCALGLCTMCKGRQVAPPQNSALQGPVIDQTGTLLTLDADTSPTRGAREPATLS